MFWLGVLTGALAALILGALALRYFWGNGPGGF